MARLHFSLKRFNLIKIFFLRAISGFLPVIIAFLLPLITDIEFSSIYFQKFSQAIILSSILKLGLDQTILKSQSSFNKLKNLLLIVFISHFLVFLGFFVLDFKFKTIVYGSFFISINSIISSFFLTNDFKIKAVCFQFIIPSFLIIGFSILKMNPILVVSLSYGSILITLFSKHFIFSSFEIVNDLFNKQFKDNLPLIGYNVLGVLLMNAPIALADLFISDLEVVLLYKMLKVFSLSSFISMIIIFTFNNEIREWKSTNIFFKYVRNFIPAIIFFFFALVLLIDYKIIAYDFDLIAIFFCSIIIYFILAGNIAGHFIILKSHENSLFKIMLYTLLVTLTAFIVINNFSVMYIFAFYIITTFLESLLKIKFIWKLR